MSQQNVEIVRGMYEATNRGDADGAVETLAPEIEIHLAGVFPDLEPVYRAHEGVRKWVEQTREPWEELSVEPDRVIDLGARVLVLAHFQVMGRDGIEVQRPVGHVWTMRNGQAVRMDAYSNHQNALEAVGLSEQDIN
jgi:hypothetical protein